MKYTPILFKGAMVRAILAGTKTQTRRIVKPQPTKLAGPNFDGLWSDTIDPVVRYFACPHGAPGDRLWVKETFRVNGTMAGPRIKYAADDGERWPVGCPDNCPDWVADDNNWRPSIFMRRYASRITLELTAVRVERLNDISEADAKAEGIGLHSDGSYYGAQFFIGHHTAVSAYAELWESINGAGSWAANPWVWVETFRRVDA